VVRAGSVGDAVPERARGVQRALAIAALLGVAVGAAAGYLVSTDAAEEVVEERAAALAEETVASTETVVGGAIGGLRGAQALVDEDGVVDREDFESFGAGVVNDLHAGIALGLVVRGEDRAAFEAAEAPITQRRPGGASVPADPATEHFPVVAVVSADPTNQSVIGFDYATDEVRATAVRQARDAGTTVLSEPTPLQPTGLDGFVAVQPLYRRGVPVDGIDQRRAAFVGYLTVAYQAADVFATIGREIRPGTSVVVRDGSTTVFAAGRPVDEVLGSRFARSAEVDVAGRRWQVTVLPVEPPARALPLFVAIGGGVAEAGLLLLFTVTSRYQRRLRRANEAERVSQQRSRTMEALAARLSRSLSKAEVGRALLEDLPPYTGTTAGAVLMLDEAGDVLEVVATDGYGAAAPVPVDASGASAIADALRAGEPAWLASPLAWRDDPVTAAYAEPGRAVAVVPLVADRRAVGVMVLVHAGVRGFYEEERGLLDTVAALAARALLRAARYDAEHDAAVVLQRALLPTVLPDLDDVDVAVRYLPATGGLDVGGDWYDVFALGDGRVGVVVGDVVGRGVKAAAAMGSLRSAARALAVVQPEPAALLRAFEAHVPTIPDALCATMVYAVVDPAAGRATVVRAGHPPALVVRVDGSAELLDGPVSPPLGVTGGAPVTPVTVPMDPGDVLVLYTDGIVERRGEPITTGLERLRSAAAAAAGSAPEACCDRIVADLIPDAGHGDDAALVVLRLDPVASTMSAPVVADSDTPEQTENFA
jgi:CHASE1-domain containing sensor protein